MDASTQFHLGGVAFLQSLLAHSGNGFADVDNIGIEHGEGFPALEAGQARGLKVAGGGHVLLIPAQQAAEAGGIAPRDKNPGVARLDAADQAGGPSM